MFKNYFKTAIRSLLRNKGYSVLNILGLAIGMASALLILLWVQNEMSMDRFHEKEDRLYIMNNRDHFSGELQAWNTTPKILGPTMKQELPEVALTSRYSNSTFLFTVGEKKLKSNGAFVDSSFLKMFSFPLLKGKEPDVLNSNNKVVLTAQFAKALFGNTDPLGKTLRLDSTDLFTVSGILKDLPNNTQMKFDYLIPWSYLKKINQDDQYWGNNSVKTYILLKAGVRLDALNAKVRDIAVNHTKGSGDVSITQVFAFPLSKMYLYNKSENGQYVAGNLLTVRLFSIIAVFILLIACINFMNLSTARSEKRAKEVGVRKVVGARKGALVLQFLTESIIISCIAFIVAIVMVTIALPFFNTLVNKQLHVDYGNGWFWAFALTFIIATGILAGSYPAFFLSSFSPVKVLKGTFKKAQSKVNPRSILVVVQFTFAIILIISTMIVSRQIHYIQRRDRGYNQDALLYTPLEGEIDKNYLLIRQELLNSRAVTSVTKSMSPITNQWSDGWGYSWQGSTPEDEKMDFGRFSTDADFVKTMGMKLLQGRDIDIYQYPTDSTSVLLTETAVKAMRLQNPLGALIKGDDKNWRVVGIIKDFIINSPSDKIGPMIILGPGSWFNYLHYRLNPAHSTADNLKTIEGIFKKYNPDYPFGYTFVDANYAQKFASIQRTGKLATLFAGLTIFISCLGLFGLAAYMAETRKKEIGVRKVLGASVPNITTLLSKDFLKLVVLSFIIASPIAWYAMDQWLMGYNYRIPISWWVFALAGVLSVLIALLTVGFQAMRAARANPVKSLRTE